MVHNYFSKGAIPFVQKTCAVVAGLLVVWLLGACEKEPIPIFRDNKPAPTDTIFQSPDNISGTWKVKSLSISGELTNVNSPPDSAIYPDISITIPNETQGFIEGHLFYNMIRFQYEISGQNQIRFSNISQYVENELIIWLKKGIDATEFAANSNLGIAPKRSLGVSFNIWLFETDGTKPLHELIAILSQNVDVDKVQYNHTGITLRDINGGGASFIDNLRNTSKFNILNDELTFIDSLDNPLIIFIKH